MKHKQIKNELLFEINQELSRYGCYEIEPHFIESLRYQILDRGIINNLREELEWKCKRALFDYET